MAQADSTTGGDRPALDQPRAAADTPSADEVILPFDEDSATEEEIKRGLEGGGTRDAAPKFLYIGEGKSADEFSAYVKTYNFGTQPPDYVVLHHTANPGLNGVCWGTPCGSWNAGEEGLTDEQIYQKRKGRLDGMRNYYRDTNGWDRGPHLFIDDRYIWLFTPMYYEGIHAKWGNQFKDAQGKPHYSVGIEVVGYYEDAPWSAPVANMVGRAVAALKQQLGTFELEYMYPTPESKPGMVGSGLQQRCAHPDRLKWGGISSHRDYNKPACPGKAITEEFYIQVLRAGLGG